MMCLKILCLSLVLSITVSGNEISLSQGGSWSLPGQKEHSITALRTAETNLLFAVGNAPLDYASAATCPWLGQATDGNPYVSGFLLRISPPDQPEIVLAFAPGSAWLSSLVIDQNSIYITGYGTAGMNELIASMNGMQPRTTHAPLPQQYFTPKEHFSDPKTGNLGRGDGIPFIIKLSRTDYRPIAGTWLEGRHGVWHVPKPLNEDWWQPVAVQKMQDGDLIVMHDEGYNRSPSAGTMEDYYLAGDFLSRLSPDLNDRRWIRHILQSDIDPVSADEYLKTQQGQHRMSIRDTGTPWSATTLGNTRTLHMTVDAEGAIYLAGYASSRTSHEPWWSPFLLRYNQNGETTGRAWTHNPMSGDNGRLNNLVSDSAIRSVTILKNGDLLVSAIGDGGNSVLRKDPAAYTGDDLNLRGNIHSFRGRTLFWGTWSRLRRNDLSFAAGTTISGFAKNRLTPAWIENSIAWNDMYAGVGRAGDGFNVTDKAWSSEAGGLMILTDSNFVTRFATTMPGILPRCIAALPHKLILAGSLPQGGPALLYAEP